MPSCLALALGIVTARAEPPPSERVDYLSFAQGTVPIGVTGDGATRGAGFEEAVRAIDGDPTGFTLQKKPGAASDTVFVYALPAPTTFDHFAVPNVLETPSPSATFVSAIEVRGSASGPDGGWTTLASATLRTHEGKGQVTELPIVARPAVRWIEIRLSGGIELPVPSVFTEFSELVGYGRQEPVPQATGFDGTWRTTGFALELEQRGPVVTGCYDREGDLAGTVTGNVLRATGVNRSGGNPSAFVLVIAPDGAIRGVRSSNGAPFRLWTGPRADDGTAGCAVKAPPSLGCGSIVHGITFDYDSATIRPESVPVLAELFAGLRADPSSAIVIEGHTSSEGTDTYNQTLSEKRAKAVVEDLVRRGLQSSRISAVGVGEVRPLADNNTEAGRSLNRRVEVRCR